MGTRRAAIPDRTGNQRGRPGDLLDLRKAANSLGNLRDDPLVEGALLFTPPAGFEEKDFFSRLNRMGYRSRPLAGQTERWDFADSYEGTLFKKGVALFRSDRHDSWHVASVGLRKDPPNKSSHQKTVRALAHSRSLLPLLTAGLGEQRWQLRSPSAHRFCLSILRWEFSDPFGNRAEHKLEILALTTEQGSRIDREYVSILLVEQLDCRPFTSSVLEEGLAALKQPPPGAPLLPEYIVDRRDSVASACGKIVGGQVYKLKAKLLGALHDLHPEYVHDMRVAIRRLRSALRLFSPILPAKRCEEIRAELASTGRLLGGVRDLDVLLSALPAQLARIDAPERFREQLMQHLRERREESLSRLRKGIDRRSFQAFLDSIVPSLELRRGAFSSSPIVAFAESRIERALKRVAKWPAQTLEEVSEEEFHALRILCKRLRYTCEFFLPVGGSLLARVIKACISLQDCIGNRRDATLAIERLVKLSRESPLDAEGAMLSFGALVQIQRDRRSMEHERFEALWKSFQGVHRDWKSRESWAVLAERNGKEATNWPPSRSTT